MISVKDPVPVVPARVDIFTMASRLMLDRLISRSTSASVDWTDAPTCNASPSTRAISTMRSFWFLAVATMMLRGQPVRRRDSARRSAVLRSPGNIPQFRSASWSVAVLARASM